MLELWRFLMAVASNWLVLLSGAAIVTVIGVAERLLRKNLSVKVYVALIILLLFYACFLAWKDEKDRSVALGKDNNTLNQRITGQAAALEEKDKRIGDMQLLLNQKMLAPMPTSVALTDAAKAALEKQRTTTDRLADFLGPGNALLQRCVRERGSPEVEQAANDWYNKVLAFIEQNLGKSFAARFKDTSDKHYVDAPVDYPLAKLELYYGIRARLERLHEFIKELQASMPLRD